MIFLRPEAPLMGGYRIIANDQFVGKFQSGKHLVVSTTPGNHLLQVSRLRKKSSKNRETIIVTIEPGKTHYFLVAETVAPGGRLELVEITEQSGKRLLAKQEIWRKRQANRAVAAQP
jgi:hypothetical protein